MYPSFLPRLGILHFTLAIVFFPFGAPQAQSVPARIRTARSVVTPATVTTPVARAPREIGTCIAWQR
jgi:hypothetical protein